MQVPSRTVECLQSIHSIAAELRGCELSPSVWQQATLLQVSCTAALRNIWSRDALIQVRSCMRSVIRLMDREIADSTVSELGESWYLRNDLWTLYGGLANFIRESHQSNARFWAFINGDYVKLKLSPGGSVTHCNDSGDCLQSWRFSTAWNDPMIFHEKAWFFEGEEPKQYNTVCSKARLHSGLIDGVSFCVPAWRDAGADDVAVGG